jgi:hypothetical protein
MGNGECAGQRVFVVKTSWQANRSYQTYRTHKPYAFVLPGLDLGAAFVAGFDVAGAVLGGGLWATARSHGTNAQAAAESIVNFASLFISNPF